MSGRERFLFVLAERLGRTVGELRATMSARELACWEFYFGVRTSAADHKASDRRARAMLRGMS